MYFSVAASLEACGVAFVFLITFVWLFWQSVSARYIITVRVTTAVLVSGDRYGSLLTQKCTV